MANTKKITRDDQLRLRLSKQERALFEAYAKELGINPSRLGRNIIMSQAESIVNKPFIVPIFEAYKKYLKVTNQKKALERMKTPWRPIGCLFAV